jgi:hypothetical protein
MSTCLEETLHCLACRRAIRANRRVRRSPWYLGDLLEKRLTWSWRAGSR